jgi:hypothetical protein
MRANSFLSFCCLIILSTNIFADARKGHLEFRADGVACSNLAGHESFFISSLMTGVYLSKSICLGLAATVYPTPRTRGDASVEAAFTTVSRRSQNKVVTAFGGWRFGHNFIQPESLYTVSAFGGGRMYFHDGYAAISLCLNISIIFGDLGAWHYLGPMLSISVFI